MNTFPIKQVDANKAIRQFKALGNQINKIYLSLEYFGH